MEEGGGGEGMLEVERKGWGKRMDGGRVERKRTEGGRGGGKGGEG